MATDNDKSKRIAKNTAVLYVRMIFLMLITLYTSRVILKALGVEDYGVYNVVGGFVAMFQVLNKSLSSACSRFLNYEMGKGTEGRLKTVFSCSVSIHIILAVVIGLICEAIGVWFVNHKMVIAQDRLYAANWVFQFSILTFCSTLITVPYNAIIIAHERMKAFAYVGIFEGIAKLVIAFVIMISPFDTLIFYALLIALLQFLIQYVYRYYCNKNFEECTITVLFDKKVFKEIFGFAGWNFIGSSSAILRNQGGNILINLFFGPAVNAARAVANLVLHAVDGFVKNFMTALNPQITQSYAHGNLDYMMKLVFQGSRLSYYLLMLLSLPIILNVDYILQLWLEDVPEYSNLFVRLTLIFTAIESISGTLITAQLATGNIRNYQIVVGGIQMLNLPISYFVYALGGSPESFLIVAIGCSLACLVARIYMLKAMIPIKVGVFVSNVVLNVFMVSVCSSIVPILMLIVMPTSFFSVIGITIMSLLTSLLSIYYIGCNKQERSLVKVQVLKIKAKIVN